MACVLEFDRRLTGQKLDQPIVGSRNAGLLLRLSANADQLSLVSSQAREQSGDALTLARIELVEMLRAGL